MRRIIYNKANGSLEMREKDLSKKIIDPIGKYISLFEDVPLWSGQEWRRKNATDKELLEIFYNALDRYLELSKEVMIERENLTKEYHKISFIKKIFGKSLEKKLESIPKPVSKKDIIEEMVSRCNELSEWMKKNKNRPFYCKSDMNDFINRPEFVATELKKLL